MVKGLSTLNRGPELLVDMDDLCRSEPVEPRGRGVAISSNVLRIDQVLDFQFRQYFRKGDSIERVTRLPEYGTDLLLADLEGLQMVLAMVENDATEGVINAVINIVARFAVAYGATD